jgi:hypothetical protein
MLPDEGQACAGGSPSMMARQASAVPDLWRPSPKSAVKPDRALAGIRITVG